MREPFRGAIGAGVAIATPSLAVDVPTREPVARSEELTSCPTRADIGCAPESRCDRASRVGNSLANFHAAQRRGNASGCSQSIIYIHECKNLRARHGFAAYIGSDGPFGPGIEHALPA